MFYKIKFFLKKIKIHIPYNFFLKIVKDLFGFFIAHFLVFFLKLFYPKDKIVCNIFWGSVGHLTLEFDYLFLKLSKLKKSIKIIVFCNNHINNRVIFNNFKNYFRFFISNNYLFYYISKISIKYKKNFLDSALSDIFYHYQKLNNQRSYREVWKLHNKYYILKKKLKINPFLDKTFDNQNLNSFFLKNNILKKEYAVIHIKEVEGNSCALRTSPDSYIETIEYLNSIGLKVIFGGREKMPYIFKKLNVINFSNSNFAKDYEDDLCLVRNSSFVLSFASGYANIPDIFRIPNVCCGFWLIQIPPFSAKTVFLPTVLDYFNSQKVSFKEQLEIIYRVKGNFKMTKNIIAINPSSEQILSSTQQALNKINLNKSYLLLQSRFKNQFNKEPINYSECQISEIFLRENIMRF
jgi:putative glycosyltransferase (TIGR04372 family)